MNVSALFQQIGEPRILVIGDLMLDRYTWGNAERVSPEAPVMVLRADESEVRLGGAASVASLLRHLDAKVFLAGVIGDDAEGRTLRQLLAEPGINHELVAVDPNRPTTTKERFLGRAANRHPYQMLRVDHEVCDEISGDLADHVAERIDQEVSNCDAVLISDYDKGFCTERLVQVAIEAACRHGVPVVIDPARIANFRRYRGNCVLTPNRIEAELATGLRICNSEDGLSLGQLLCERLGLRAAMVTLDRDGIAVTDRYGTHELIPARAREVYDITGAGDMVLAVVGLCLASGIEIPDAARIANAAAGCEVEKLGVAAVTWPEVQAELIPHESSRKHVTLDEMTNLAESHRRRAKTIVFTNGCFDLLHVGHATYLQQAAQLGDVLIVAINSDNTVRRLKGSTRPIIGQNDRSALLAALACVDYVVVFEEDTPHRLLRALRPDVLVKGGTYTVDQVVGREVVAAYGGTVAVTDEVTGKSTTRIISSLQSGSVDLEPSVQSSFQMKPTSRRIHNQGEGA